MKQGMNTVTFTLDAISDQIGVDPFLLLIDRVPADNLKRCDLQAESSRCVWLSHSALKSAVTQSGPQAD